MPSFLISTAKDIFLSGVSLLKVIFIFCGAIFIMLISIPIVLTLAGYKVNGGATEIAQMAVEKQNVHECSRIFSYGLFAPPTGDKRRTCIRIYAELTKDPSICALLMPSSYGLSCVGGAEVSLLCDVTSVPHSVYWRDGNIEHTEHLRECLKSDPRRSEIGNLCCQMAQVSFLKDKNDCSPLKKNQEIYDHCLYRLAWKLRNPAYCSDISNVNAHKACEVQTKALQKDPSICSGCTRPVESVDELFQESPL